MTSYSPLDVSEHPREKRRVHWSEQLESVEEVKGLELTVRGNEDDEEIEVDQLFAMAHQRQCSSLYQSRM